MLNTTDRGTHRGVKRPPKCDIIVKQNIINVTRIAIPVLSDYGKSYSIHQILKLLSLS